MLLSIIRKHLHDTKISVPILEKKHHKWFLRFAFEEDVKLKNTEDKILAIDLGINTDATCSVIRKDGTILCRDTKSSISKSFGHLYSSLYVVSSILE